ncbi:MAG: biopolymer transporter ExbD, partial [Bacteroidales bacterium]|nr:biopolymer transporter ExbD [Bacteroidales bacterium]
MAKPAGEINAGSMADIAFLLLIFFLVTTTMDVETGIQRRLPPMPDENQQAEVEQINKRNIMVVLINKNDRLFAGGQE